MIIVIDTQDHENYGYRWKAKGGSEYKILNVPASADAAEIVDMVRSQIERRDEYFTTDIIGYRKEADDYLSWFERSQLEYDGEIRYPEPTIELGELA